MPWETTVIHGWKKTEKVSKQEDEIEEIEIREARRYRGSNS